MSDGPLYRAIEDRLALFRQKTRFNAGSLIVSVFGDAVLPRGGTVWLGSLIQLVQPLGLNERLVRTTVFRLVKDEWLQAQAQGRRTDYQLTETGRRRFEEASRLIYAPEAPLWDRRWRMIAVVKELEAARREQLRRALYWQGFGELGPTCFVHPSADLQTVLDDLGADGMADLLPQIMPLLALNLELGQSASDAEMVQSTWNLDELSASYQRFVARYQPLLEAMRPGYHETVDGEHAFLIRTLLIHDYRRLLLRDPELPAVLLPAQWPGHDARVLCREIYRRLLAPSERYLDRMLALANGTFPPASGLVERRFQRASLLDQPT